MRTMHTQTTQARTLRTVIDSGADLLDDLLESGPTDTWYLPPIAPDDDPDFLRRL